jgi:cysteine synthase A
MFDLIEHEGLVLGGSTGINVAARDPAGARRSAPATRIVTILCDGGSRYQSKLFNPDFLTSEEEAIPAGRMP